MIEKFSLLEDQIIDRIIGEALEVLENRGVFIENEQGKKLLFEAGLTSQTSHGKEMVLIDRSSVENALAKAPSFIELYSRDNLSKPALNIGNDNVHFYPGAAAIYYYDYSQDRIRDANTPDLVKLLRLTDSLANLDAQSSSMVPSDLPKALAGRYRLYLMLKNCSKPIVTGTFRKNSFDVMKEMLVAVRGDERSLAEHPLAIFCACSSPPLKWSDLTCHDLIKCARSEIPVQLISVPMSGASAPVTLIGSVVQHTAENLSGLVLSQLAKPGAPVIYGGSPTIIDMKKGNTPLGAVETMMLNAACNEVGKRLGLPTHAYMGLSDSKRLDSQSGLESGIGTILGALAGVNMIAGPGMMAFENCQSAEKLVIDNEICGMAKRLLEGIKPRNGEDRLAQDLFSGDIYKGNHFLTSPITLKWLREEFYSPSSVIDRNEKDVWEQKGSLRTDERAHARVEEVLEGYEPVSSPERADDADLEEIIKSQAKKHGLTELPHEV